MRKSHLTALPNSSPLELQMESKVKSYAKLVLEGLKNPKKRLGTTSKTENEIRFRGRFQFLQET